MEKTEFGGKKYKGFHKALQNEQAQTLAFLLDRLHLYTAASVKHSEPLWCVILAYADNIGLEQSDK